METVLLIAYLAAFMLMIAEFLMCLMKKAKWRTLLIFEVVSLLASVSLSFGYEHYWFQTPPSGDSLWRLNYLGEILFSRIAIWLFGIMLAITAITRLALYIIEKSRHKAK